MLAGYKPVFLQGLVQEFPDPVLLFVIWHATQRFRHVANPVQLDVTEIQITRNMKLKTPTKVK
jgi:hypothetical protein